METIFFNFIKCLLYLHLHYMVLAGAVVLLNKKAALPAELFRKLLHIAAVFSIMPIVIPSSSREVSAFVCAVFLLEAYLGGQYSSLLEKVNMKERSEGEQKRSLFLLFGVYIFLIINCWGALGQKWMVILSVVAWGVGDAAAALVGKRFGKHKLKGKMIEGTKSGRNAGNVCHVFCIGLLAIQKSYNDRQSPACCVGLPMHSRYFRDCRAFFKKWTGYRNLPTLGNDRIYDSYLYCRRHLKEESAWKSLKKIMHGVS